MIWLDIEDVYKLHELIIKRAGSKAGVRDFALLHSAVERPKASYQGQDLYPTIFLKAASLLQSICLNHPFTDGNKRTAFASAARFLWVNGYYLRPSRGEAVKFMYFVDSSKPDIKEIARWLKRHSKVTKKA